MNQSIKKLWVEALRSGEYRQIKGQLKSDGRYCCLGVLCELYKQKIDPHFQFGLKMYLPREIQLWAELEDQDPSVKNEGKLRYLSELNDIDDLGFNEIAELIEKCL